MAKRAKEVPPSRTPTLPAKVAATMGASNTADAAGEAVSHTVGENLRRLRTERGWSLENLATRSGVSRAMLGQIELGKSAPTINVLWKIVAALDVPFSALLSAPARQSVSVVRAKGSKSLVSFDGSFRSRALFPFEGAKAVEFYELQLERGGREQAEAHPPGTTENLVVAAGRIAIELAGQRFELDEGDAIHFLADEPHTYLNTGSKAATMFLVMTYARKA